MLSVPDGFRMLAVKTLARLCSQMAVTSARGLSRDLLGWTPRPRAVLRMVDAAGEQARTLLEQKAPPEEGGTVLAVAVDGKSAPAISSKEYAPHARSCLWSELTAAPARNTAVRETERIGSSIMVKEGECWNAASAHVRGSVRVASPPLAALPAAVGLDQNPHTFRSEYGIGPALLSPPRQDVLGLPGLGGDVGAVSGPRS